MRLSDQHLIRNVARLKDELPSLGASDQLSSLGFLMLHDEDENGRGFPLRGMLIDDGSRSGEDLGAGGLEALRMRHAGMRV